jgi:hypothetical protein
MARHEASPPDPEELANAALERLDAAEERLAPAIAASIRVWLERVRAAILGDPGVLPSLDAYPDAAEWDAIVNAGIVAEARGVYEAAWDGAMAGLVPGPDLDAVVAERGPAVQRFLQDVPSRLRTLPTEAFEVIRTELLDGLEAGDSIDRIRDRIGYVTDLDVPSRPHRERLAAVDAQLDAALADPATDPVELARIRGRRSAVLADLRDADREWHYRARRIARTEATTAVNGGEYHAATARQAATGIRARKQWMATGDSRTRRTHRRANGQVREWAQPFNVGGYPMDHPGDPSAPGALTINCRCILVTLYGDDGPLDLAPIGDDDGDDPENDELTASGGLMTGERASWSTRMTTKATPRKRSLVAAPVAPPAVAPPPPGVDNEGGADSTDASAAALPLGWRGLLVPFDVESGDGRMVATPPTPRARPLPLPLMAQEALTSGHDGAVTVGRIDRIWIGTEDGVTGVFGEGLFDLADAEGKAWARRVADGFASGVSVDLGDAVVAERFLDASTGAELDPDTAIEILMTDPQGESKVKYLMVAEDWQMMGATLVAHPAFWQARVEPIFDYAGPSAAVVVWPTDRAPGAGSEPVAAAEGDYTPAVGDKVRVTGGSNDGATGTVAAIDADAQTADVALDGADAPTDPVTVPFAQLQPADEPDEQQAPPPGAPPMNDEASILLAAATAARAAGHPGLPAGPQFPPAAWFSPPKLAGPTALTVDADGRIYGHLATWNTCHTGGVDACITAPRSQHGYAYFHTGEVVADDGTRIACGVITAGGGHADVRSPMRGAMEHYDDTGAAVAVVVASEDAHGIVLAGALLPEATDRQVACLMRSPLSGDWRKVGRDLELIAALAVNAPGFPVPRPRAAMATPGEQTALVAAGALPPPKSGRVRLGADRGTAGAEVVLSAILARSIRKGRVEQLAARFAADPSPQRWAATRAALAELDGTARTLAERVARSHGYRGDGGGRR